MKKKLILFLNFTFVIAGLSAVATGYVLESRMDRKTAEMADLVRGQALMVRQRAEQLEKVAAQMAASQDTASRQSHADEVKSNATAMQQYADGLMQKMAIENPRQAMTAMADLNPLAPEDLNRIKRQHEEIEHLSQDNMSLKTTVAGLERKLYNCRARRPSYSPDYRDPYDKAGPEQEAR